MNENMEEIMLDLLCKKAVYGLDQNEAKQLADLQRQLGVEDESLSFDITTAKIAQIGLDPTVEMPAALRERIVADAEKHFAAIPDVKAFASSSPHVADKPVRGPVFNWLGWGLAAAACAALALNIYFTRSGPAGGGEVVGGPPTPTPEQRLTPAQERQKLIETAPDLARGSWGAGNVKDVTPSGDVVWSDSKQAGYVRLSGLPKNDPNQKTYQLWIFDETQSDKTPIDGGTFDVNADGEIIIPINAKLRPRNTKMFAITVEKAGGVVVSERKELVALAKRET